MQRTGPAERSLGHYPDKPIKMIYNPAELPKDFDSLVRLYPPRAIRNRLVHEKTMEMVDALTLVPDLSSGQLAYLDTLSVLVEYYEAEKDCWTERPSSR